MFKRIVVLAIVSGGLMAPAARAAMAVVDVRAIAELRSQIQALEQQLQTARQHLSQAQAEYQALTGPRGMERLLAGTAWNYLPPDWAALEAALHQAGGGYPVLAAEIAAVIGTNAVLTPQQVALLSLEEREQLEAARRSAALLQVTSRQALGATSGRFAAIQHLIDAIGTAQDPKAVMDLQARIAAEQAMLQNEQTKIHLLFQVAQAEEWARKQRAREQAIASIGSLRRLPPIGLSH